MPTIYSPGQISAGTLNVAPINIGTQKSLEILNYSSYFLCLATTQAGATDKNDHSLVTVIEPWQGIRMPVPIGTANTQLYVGVDPTLSTNPVTFGNVVDLPGVQYQTFNVVVAPSRWALLGQSVVNPDGATVGTLVNNSVTTPAQTNETPISLISPGTFTLSDTNDSSNPITIATGPLLLYGLTAEYPGTVAGGANTDYYDIYLVIDNSVLYSGYYVYGGGPAANAQMTYTYGQSDSIFPQPWDIPSGSTIKVYVALQQGSAFSWSGNFSPTLLQKTGG